MSLSSIICRQVLICCCLAAQGWSAPVAGEFAELRADRVAAIERMLPTAPAGFGRPVSDRAFWAEPGILARCGDPVRRAEPLLKRPFPAWSDELYLEFSRIGRRPPGEAMIGARTAWLEPLVLAECVENKGRFLPLLEQVLTECANQPCWTLPAHDRSLDNFHRRKYTVDLRSAEFGAELAQAHYLLGGRLTPAVRGRVSAALEQRVFQPFRASLRTHKDHWWLGNKSHRVKNNWNAVCLAGVAGAARTVLADRHERAVMLAAAEHYSQYFVNGFTRDGYCDEGPGYWVYGFGSHVALREIVREAAGGGIDLFNEPKARAMALYGSRIRFPSGDVPPFADCRTGTKLKSGLTGYCDRVFGLAARPAGPPPALGLGGLAWKFLPETPAPGKAVAHAPDFVLRSYFDVAGVLVCRAGNDPARRFAAAIKTGGNGSHSHNDIGSFVVSLNGEQPVGDPGGPHAYDNLTFGPRRYERKLLNSFGHPVPVVAGQLQLDATRVKPQVLATRFAPERDRITMDLAAAYQVKALRVLTRTADYARSGAGSLTIEDHVTFSEPAAFEEGLATRWQVVQTAPDRLEFSKNGKKLVAEITTPDGFELTTTIIEELGAPPFTRLGLKLRKPVADATIRMVFRPAGGT